MTARDDSGASPSILVVGREEHRCRALCTALGTLGAEGVGFVEETRQALPGLRAGRVDALVILSGARWLALRKLLEEAPLPEPRPRLFVVGPAHAPEAPFPLEVTPLEDTAEVAALAATLWRALGQSPPPPPRFEPREKLTWTPAWEASRAWDVERQRRVLVAWQGEHEQAHDRDTLLEGARRAQRVEHRNLPRVLELGETFKHRGFQCWEDVPGVWLPELLRTRRERGPLGLDVCVWIAAEVAETLLAVHAEGLAHGLLDAESVWLTPEGGVRLLYLGAGELAIERLLRRNCRVGTVPSTADMPPEMVLSPSPNPASDVYRLGLLLYRLLWGGAPFDAARKKGAWAELEAVTREPASPPASGREGVPEALTALVLRMLEKDPERRPNCASVLSHLDGVLDSPSGTLLRREVRRGMTANRLRLFAPPEELVERLRPLVRE